MSNANIGNYSNNAGDGGCNSGGSSGGGISGGGPCGACKFLRRKCVPGCIFAPYFDPEQGAAHFAAVHRVFGASNVQKLLTHIPVHKRLDTVVTICYEAQARLRDPIYGCVAHIFALQQQVISLQTEIAYLNAHLTTLNQPTPPPIPQQPLLLTPPQLSISDLPSASSVPTTFDLSAMVNPLNQPSWTTQQPNQAAARANLDSRQFLATNTPRSSSAAGGGYADHNDLMGGDLHELAREFFQRHARPSSSDGTCNEDESNE